MSKHPTLLRAAALAAAIIALSVGRAGAVSVNPYGLGQVLLFPYYSAQLIAGSPNTTLLSLTNTDGVNAKALSVRFLEAKAGAEVLGFNVFLAPNQTWTAAVVQQTPGVGGVLTFSGACTTPSFPSGGTVVNFVNFAYAGDGMGNGLDRTLEGHVRVIEMATYAPGSQTFARVVPVNGVAQCGVSDSLATQEAQAPTGKLMGYAEIVNVLEGTSFAAVPTALDAFSATALYFPPGNARPNLGDVNPPRALVKIGNSVISAAGFPRAIDAVSAVLMHAIVYNEFVNDAAFGSATDWVLTFPTKADYYTAGAPVALFQRSITPTGACDDIRSAVNALPQGAATGTLCFATNVVSFNSGFVLGSANPVNFATIDIGGFASIQPMPLPAPGVHVVQATGATIYSLAGIATTGAASFYGLPMIGFAARRILVGQVNIPDGFYETTDADTSVHKYQESFTSP